mmetsp:Transcript_44362/g.102473  ORF Transcript_44362/g.102473 Transcript_44362/m.102473 type:complete len:201 (-) Transcript_44362:175-777(-)
MSSRMTPRRPLLGAFAKSASRASVSRANQKVARQRPAIQRTSQNKARARRSLRRRPVRRLRPRRPTSRRRLTTGSLCTMTSGTSKILAWKKPPRTTPWMPRTGARLLLPTLGWWRLLPLPLVVRPQQKLALRRRCPARRASFCPGPAARAWWAWKAWRRPALLWRTGRQSCRRRTGTSSQWHLRHKGEAQKGKEAQPPGS